jgi:hypothetical protein
MQERVGAVVEGIDKVLFGKQTQIRPPLYCLVSG